MAAMMRTSTWLVRARAHRSNLAVLEDAQHLGLDARAHLADLVEKERAAGGQLELSRVLGRRRR